MAGMVAKLSIDVPPFRHGDLVQVLAQADDTTFEVKNHTSAGSVPDYALHFQPQLKELPPLEAVGRIASITVDSRPFIEGELVQVIAKREGFNMFDVRNNAKSGCVSVSVLSFEPEGTKLPSADTQPPRQGEQAQAEPSMVGRVAMLRFDSRPFKGGELVQVVSKRDGTNMFEVRNNTKDGIIAGSALDLQPEGTTLPQVSDTAQTLPVKPVSMEGRLARFLFDCRPFKEGTLVKVVAKKDGVNMFDVTNNDRNGCVPGSALCFDVDSQELPNISNPGSNQQSPTSTAEVSPEKDGKQPSEAESTPPMQPPPASIAEVSPKKDGIQLFAEKASVQLPPASTAKVSPNRDGMQSPEKDVMRQQPPASTAKVSPNRDGMQSPEKEVMQLPKNTKELPKNTTDMVGRVAKLVSTHGPFQKDELVQISSVDERACKFDVRSHVSKGSVPESVLVLLPEGTQLPPAKEGCCAGCAIS